MVPYRNLQCVTEYLLYKPRNSFTTLVKNSYLFLVMSVRENRYCCLKKILNLDLLYQTFWIKNLSLYPYYDVYCWQSWPHQGEKWSCISRRALGIEDYCTNLHEGMQYRKKAQTSNQTNSNKELFGTKKLSFCPYCDVCCQHS